MNKFLAKTIGKWKIWTAIAAVLIVAGIVIASVFGFNLAPTANSVKTLTVRLESYASSASVEKIESITDSKLREKGLEEKYSVDVELSSGKVHEYVYTFKEKIETKVLNEVKESVKTAFDAEKKNAESPLYNAFVYVTVNEEVVASNLAKGFLWRGILAGAVFAVAAFVYSAIRHKLHGGALTLGGIVVSTALATALVALCRIPVTASVAYALAFTMLLSAALSLLVVTSLKEGEKADENKDKTREEAALASLPVNLLCLFVCVVAVALALVGAIAVTPVAWLAVAALVGLVAAVFTCVILLPAVYLPVKKAVDKKAEARARYDYKKGAKKADKAEKTEKESDQ